MKIERLEKYTPEAAEQVRGLLIQLSRSSKDKGEIPEEWFRDIIASPWHDLLVARDDDEEDGASGEGGAAGKRIVGIASLSVLMGPGIRKNAYLEDFVTDASVRGKGIGAKLWAAMLDWAREKGCKNLEFTCGNGRETAQAFYKNHGAEIYETNFFRKPIA